MSTAVLDRPCDLSDYEFSVPCEHPGCDVDAVAMCKGCSDRRPFRICGVHFAQVKQRFDANYGKQCSGCERPFWTFDTHYNVMDL